jgi:hypothetical protein
LKKFLRTTNYQSGFRAESEPEEARRPRRRSEKNNTNTIYNSTLRVAV